MVQSHLRFTQLLRLCGLSEPFLALLPSATSLRQGNIFTSVCHSVYGGGVYPSMHWGRHPPLADTFPLGRHPPGQTPLGRHPPPCPVHAGIPPRPPAASAADGTHPTGMHSCNHNSCTNHKSEYTHLVYSTAQYSMISSRNHNSWVNRRCDWTISTKRIRFQFNVSIRMKSHNFMTDKSKRFLSQNRRTGIFVFVCVIVDEYRLQDQELGYRHERPNKQLPKITQCCLHCVLHHYNTVSG